MNRLRTAYKENIQKQLVEELDLSSIMEAPKLKKIVVNAGIGDFRDSQEAVDSFVEELTNITGQKPAARSARKSESGFKIRQGDVVGYSVTLRGERMWAFLDKFVNIVLPRFRDFKGLEPGSFDEYGNYSVGIREHVVFPEVNPNRVKGIRSLQVTFRIDAKDPKHSKVLLEKLGMPFRKD